MNTKERVGWVLFIMFFAFPAVLFYIHWVESNKVERVGKMELDTTIRPQDCGVVHMLH